MDLDISGFQFFIFPSYSADSFVPVIKFKTKTNTL